MLTYPVRLGPGDDAKVVLSFPDVPEAVVIGSSEDDVFAMAQHILETTLASYVVQGKAIPAPSDICGAPTVSTERFSLIGMELE